MKKRAVVRKISSPWFSGFKGDSWGWIPLNWKGWIALAVLVVVNAFAANYFGINEISFYGWSKFLIVFLLSLFVFVELAKYKTKK